MVSLISDENSILEQLTGHIRSNVDMLPDLLVYTLGKAYVSGVGQESALTTADSLLKGGFCSTIDRLQESVTSVADAKSYILSFYSLLEELPGIGSDHMQASVSMKPTGFAVYDRKTGSFDPQTNPAETFLDYCAVAEDRNIQVTLDMEDRNLTEYTVNIIEQAWREGRDNIGAVLQARLHRTEEQDIDRLLSDELHTPLHNRRIRWCLGTYDEPENVAYNKKEAKRKMVELSPRLLESGIYFEGATHDVDIVREWCRQGREYGALERMEGQVLLGVKAGEEVANIWKEHDVPVRVYVPWMEDKQAGIAYMRRRIKENPDIALMWLDDTVKSAKKRLYSFVSNLGR